MKLFSLLLGLLLSIEASATQSSCSYLFEKRNTEESQYINPHFANRWFPYNSEQNLIGLNITLKIVNANKKSWNRSDDRGFFEKLAAFIPEKVAEGIYGGGLKIKKNSLLNENGRKVTLYQVQPDYSGLVVAQSQGKIIIRQNPDVDNSSINYIIIGTSNGGSLFARDYGYSHVSVRDNDTVLFQVRSSVSDSELKFELERASSFPMLKHVLF